MESHITKRSRVSTSPILLVSNPSVQTSLPFSFRPPPSLPLLPLKPNESEHTEQKLDDIVVITSPLWKEVAKIRVLFLMIISFGSNGNLFGYYTWKTVCRDWKTMLDNPNSNHVSVNGDNKAHLPSPRVLDRYPTIQMMTLSMRGLMYYVLMDANYNANRREFIFDEDGVDLRQHYTNNLLLRVRVLRIVSFDISDIIHFDNNMFQIFKNCVYYMTRLGNLVALEVDKRYSNIYGSVLKILKWGDIYRGITRELIHGKVIRDSRNEFDEEQKRTAVVFNGDVMIDDGEHYSYGPPPVNGTVTKEGIWSTFTTN